MPVKLLRVGQLCGHTRTGYWNTDEMWPIMFASSAHPSISAIPDFKGKVVDWVPVDIAARTISDILLSDQQQGGYAVHNIVNPSPIPWSELIEMLQEGRLGSSSNKKMDVVSMKAWVQRLSSQAEVGASPDEISGLRLLQFFESMALEEAEEEKKVFETEKTRGISESLRECGAFNQQWLSGNVRVWKETGFLS